MNPFDDREKAFEAKYHVDEELAFKVNARRDKLLGLWVAAQLGLDAASAESYANTLVAIDLADAHHHAMIAKLVADLAAAESAITEPQLRAEMDRLIAVARSQIMTESGNGRHTVSPT